MARKKAVKLVRYVVFQLCRTNLLVNVVGPINLQLTLMLK
ncbi:uncharacterized protein METZ01_LOCUS318994, partial [marine metagenome]